MNNFYNRTAALAARTKARSEDVRDELDAVSAGFDLLPTPDGAGTGFTDPVIVGVPTLDAHSATKAYVDASFGTNAANLAAALAAQTAAEAAQTAAELAETNAQTSETNASTSASNASTSETNAAASAATAEGWATNANVVTVATNIANINTVAADTAAINTAAANIASINNFGDTYFVSATAPLTPTEGDLWFDTVTDIMKVYNGGSWQNAGSSVNGTSERYSYTATGGQTVFAATYDAGFVDVYLNGVKLIDGTDFTATNGTDITLSAGATAGDSVEIVGYGTFEVADVYTQAQSDAKYATLTTAQTLTNKTLSTGTAFEADALATLHANALSF